MKGLAIVALVGLVAVMLVWSGMGGTKVSIPDINSPSSPNSATGAPPPTSEGVGFADVKVIISLLQGQGGAGQGLSVFWESVHVQETLGVASASVVSRAPSAGDVSSCSAELEMSLGGVNQVITRASSGSFAPPATGESVTVSFAYGHLYLYDAASYTPHFFLSLSGCGGTAQGAERCYQFAFDGISQDAADVACPNV